MLTGGIPTIDPQVKYVGVSKLRELNAAKLRENAEYTYVLQDNETPVAVLLSYDMYLSIQEQIHNGMVNTLEMLLNPGELDGITQGMDDVKAGRARPFSDVKAELRRKHAKTTEE